VQLIGATPRETNEKQRIKKEGAARIITIWKPKTHFTETLRRTLDEEVATSPHYKLDHNDDIASDAMWQKGTTRAYLGEFGFGAFDSGVSMCRVWYKHSMPDERDKYVGLRAECASIPDAIKEVTRLEDAK